MNGTGAYLMPWSKQKQREHAEAWEKCRNIMLGPGGGPEAYCERIKRVFARYALEPDGIRDAACGTGYATLPLGIGGSARYSDGSKTMVGLFNREAKMRGLSFRAERIIWQNLAKAAEPAKKILVLGNSLPYAGSWAGHAIADGFAARAIIEVKNALNGLYNSVEKNGALLFDLYHAIAEAGERVIGDAGTRLNWEIKRYPDEKVREWTIGQFSGAQHSFTLRSLYLPHAEWIAAVKQAGFRLVEKLPESLQLEPDYTTFIALKG